MLRGKRIERVDVDENHLAVQNDLAVRHLPHRPVLCVLHDAVPVNSPPGSRSAGFFCRPQISQFQLGPHAASQFRRYPLLYARFRSRV